MYLILNVYKSKYPCGRTGQDLVGFKMEVQETYHGAYNH